MATKDPQFTRIASNVNDDDDDEGHTDSASEETKEDKLDLDYKTMRSEYQNILSDAEIASPIESKYADKSKSKKTNKANMKLLYELLEKDQIVAPKLNYQYEDDDGWEYHPRLGDLEKVELTLLDKPKTKNNKNSKNNKKGRKEILWFQKQGSKRKVFISLKIKRISAIDNIKETFRMRFHIYMTWIMQKDEYMEYLDHINSKYYYEPTWKPDLEFMNAVEIHKKELFDYPSSGKYKVETFGDFYVKEINQIVEKNEFDPSLCRFLRCKLELDITFAEELELQSFPFDCQDLTCIIKGNFLNKQKYIFLPELRAPNFGSIDSRYSVLDEWDLTTAFVEFMGDKSGRKKGRQYPQIMIRLKMKRKWKIYVINIVSLLCALCGLSLCAFYLDFDQLGERLSLLITLILTSVAFSIVIQDKLPNLPYLCFLDKYILTTYFFLILIMIESVIVSTLDDEDDKRTKTDIFLFYIFSALWVILLIVVFVIYAKKLIAKEEQKLFYSTDEVDDVVNETKPTLVFDYRNSTRKGHQERILSFMASMSMDHHRNISEKDKQKFENLNRRHQEFVALRRNLSIAHRETLQHQQ